jgi:hypothetical protein
MGETSRTGWFQDRLKTKLLFYVGVPALTALLFGLNQTGMARLLPKALALPYWLGLTIPLWALLDVCSRATAVATRRYQFKPWLVLLIGALVSMALFSPYVIAYVEFFSRLLPAGTNYTCQHALSPKHSWTCAGSSGSAACRSTGSWSP